MHRLTFQIIKFQASAVYENFSMKPNGDLNDITEQVYEIPFNLTLECFKIVFKYQ